VWGQPAGRSSASASSASTSSCVELVEVVVVAADGEAALDLLRAHDEVGDPSRARTPRRRRPGTATTTRRHRGATQDGDAGERAAARRDAVVHDHDVPTAHLDRWTQVHRRSPGRCGRTRRAAPFLGDGRVDPATVEPGARRCASSSSQTTPSSPSAPTPYSGCPGAPTLRTSRTSSGAPQRRATSTATGTPPRGRASTTGSSRSSADGRARAQLTVRRHPFAGRGTPVPASGAHVSRRRDGRRRPGRGSPRRRSRGRRRRAAPTRAASPAPRAAAAAGTGTTRSPRPRRWGWSR
jgi:hypothetical protein